MNCSEEGEGEEELWYFQQKFTQDMLVGKTYRMTDDEGSTDATFNADGTAKIVDDAVEHIATYEINDEGAIVANGNDIHYLMYEEDGVLHVWNEDQPSEWTQI